MRKYITPDIEIDKFQTIYAVTTSWGGGDDGSMEDDSASGDNSLNGNTSEDTTTEEDEGAPEVEPESLY